MTTPWTPYFQEKLPIILEEIKQLVEMETPTHNKLAVDRLGEVIHEKFAALGCHVDVISQTEYGNQIQVEYGTGEEQILILGHFDTVKEIGTLDKEPWRIEDGKAYGPGTYDMKSGIVFSYFALQAIKEHAINLNKRLVFFWNSDEEVGSRSSQKHIEAEAKKSAVVLVVEPSFADGYIKTSRKGGGDFVLRAQGRAAHAGNDHANGINAIEELAHHILEIQSWTDYEAGTTLSVGTIKGGSVSNVVPEYAEAVIDVRASQISEAERITKQMQELKPFHPGASITVTGGFEKMPMERTAAVEKLFAHAAEQAKLEGFELKEIGVGGTSDGNLAASAGATVLDGLGPVGDGAHAVNEHIVIDAIPQRIALLLRLLTTL